MTKSQSESSLPFVFLLGFSASNLFFYPVTASLSDSPYYLQWTQTNTLEALCAWFSLGLLLSAIIMGAKKIIDSSPRVSLIALVFATTLSFSSFGIHLLRQLSFKQALRELGANPIAQGAGVLLVIAFVLVVIVPRFGKIRSFICGTIEVSLVILSILMINSIFTYATLKYPDYAPFVSNAEAEKTATPLKDNQDNVIILLFDELSHEFIYTDNLISDRFPHMKRFSTGATNFHAVDSPGTVTEKSIPALLIGAKEIDAILQQNHLVVRNYQGKEKSLLMPRKENLFSLAKKQGFKTLLNGWYHQYCKIFKSVLDRCVNTSLYNHSLPNSSFSILNPILTTLNIWPKNYPFGLLKQPAISSHHRGVTKLLATQAFESIKHFDSGSFQFLHFNIPHLPLIFTKDGYNPPRNPFSQSKTNYLNQVDYVDQFIRHYTEKLKAAGKYESSTIIITSDHNFRYATEKKSHKHVPLMIKMPQQSTIQHVNHKALQVEIIKCILQSNKASVCFKK